MIINNSIIVAEDGIGVSSWEAYKVLGVQPRSNGYEVNYICSNLHEKIKMWSRYKPVDYPYIGRLTEAQFKATNYGLVPPNLGDIQFSALTANNFALFKTKVWTYQPPRGGTSSPYRLSDFAGPEGVPTGYNHNAQCPVVVSIPQERVNGQNVEVKIHFNGQGGDADLSLSDLTYLANLYPAIMMRKKGSTNWHLITASHTFSGAEDDSATITIPWSYLQYNYVEQDLEIVAIATNLYQPNASGTLEPDADDYKLLPMVEFEDIYGVVRYGAIVNIANMSVFGINNVPWTEGEVEDEFRLPSDHLDTLLNPLVIKSSNSISFQVGFKIRVSGTTVFPYSYMNVQIWADNDDILNSETFNSTGGNFNVGVYNYGTANSAFTLYKNTSYSHEENDSVNNPGSIIGKNDHFDYNVANPVAKDFYFLLNVKRLFNYSYLKSTGLTYYVRMRIQIRRPDGTILAESTQQYLQVKAQ